MSMKTNDYGIFKEIHGNRTINQGHVNRLKEAIERKNLLPYFPILLNEEMEVIDGQHRLTAAIQLGYDIYYEKVPGLRIEDVMSINTNSKSWGIRDFIDSWITLDKPDYDTLKTFMDLYDFPPTIAAALLMGSTYVQGGSSVSQRIKQGEFKVGSIPQAEKVAEKMMTLKKFADFPVSRDRELIMAIIKLGKNEKFDFDRLMSKMQLHGLKLEKRPSEKYYLIQIEELYNWNAKIQVELYKSTYDATGTRPR